MSGRVMVMYAMVACAVVVRASQAHGQSTRLRPECPVLTTMPIDSAAASRMRPDVTILASATAQSVTFNGQPVVNVQFRGCGMRDTVRILERTNLPKPVVSGTTYTNVKIDVELYAYLDVNCILSQLGAQPGSQQGSQPGSQPGSRPGSQAAGTTAPADSAGRTTARTCRRKE